MLIGVLLALACGVIIWLVMNLSGSFQHKAFTNVVFGGYALRLVIQFFIRDVQFFSHAIGGDSLLYEWYGRLIAKLWLQTHVAYITVDDGFNIGATSLPQNVFAFVIYLNDGETTRLGCTAIVALAAALTAINIYTLAIQFGAEPKNALIMASIIYFEPAVLFYTSDLYKDGLVLCVTISALGSALRLSYRYSLIHALVGAVSVFLLWYVRFYLVFATVAPLLVGFAGLGSKKLTRPIIAALVLLTIGAALAVFTDILQAATERASQTFEQATSVRSIMGNVKNETGSGVAFNDGGSVWGALPQKLAYTIFSPFPWAGGSFGFQFGKIDGFLWYFIMYRAIRAVRTADKRLVLLVLTFAGPTALMYATTMANVGLIVRQRLVIVASMAVRAAIYSPKKAVKPVPKGAKAARARRSVAPRGAPV